MEPIVLQLLNVNVVVTPKLDERKSFSLSIAYDKEELDYHGVTEQEIEQELNNYIGKK